MATAAGEEAAVIAQEFIISTLIICTHEFELTLPRIGLDNVPAEVQFLLAEMRERECRINELQMRIQPRAAQYIRHASKGTINDKDTQTLERVSADYELISRLSDEKVDLAHRLKDLLIKHSNRLQAELSRITNPGGDTYNRPAYLPATGRASSAALGTSGGHTATSVQPESLVFSGASRTPITNVVSTLKAETSTAATAAASTPAPVPVVVEPAPSVSSAPSPAATPAANKRRRLNATQSSSSIQPATAMPAPSTPSAPRSAPRPPNGGATLAPTTPSVPSTPASGRPRRAASAAATNVSPTPNNNSSAGRNTSESTSMSTATNGGDEQDAEAADDASSNAGDDVDMEGDDGPYCLCQEKSYGEMIGCDNGADCPYQWFHVACVKVQKPLPPTWYCDICTEKLGFVDNTGTTQAQASGSERAARKRRR
ncbi:hypothetical protein PIIN_02305 [Serendipita indica DSM 11827]|uniref:Chromatin modification-related protein n=1 Tax=Serendipita indica (strain DSM 11827) TaxID=1109443 RepID=G4TAV7_SERID|nr:hypothetical protein PIIN_02305 [Serendipita indica DSM 11827]